MTLCHIGIHKWDVRNPPGNRTFDQAVRTCTRCGKTQMRTGLSGWRTFK